MTDQYVVRLAYVTGTLLLTILMTACSHHNTETVETLPATPVYTQPATLQECPNGGVDVVVGSLVTPVCNGLVGPQGPQGVAGAVGPQGPIGVPGVDSTPFTFEQVCVGVTPTYPSTFPEYIMLVGIKAYGVFSLNGGFWAYLPPGTYSSDGVNASCTFTIKADGTVSQ